MRGSPTSDMPMIGQGFGLAGRTETTPQLLRQDREIALDEAVGDAAVLEAIPLRQAKRASRLGSDPSVGNCCAATKTVI
jgi:hypothetical protein